MFPTVSSPRTLKVATWALGSALLLGSATMPAPALAGEITTKARIARSLTLYAGPAVEYPRVERLAPDTLLDIHGCLPGYGWCDVWADGRRGWIDASQLRIDVRGSFRPLHVAGPIIGLPVVQFSLAPYWVAHYSHYPWFDDPRYAPAIRAYRVQSRVGNTIIEYEESWPAAPVYQRPYGYYEAPPVYVHPAPVHPPVIPAPPPGVYSPPPRYRPAPSYPVPPSHRYGADPRPYGSGHQIYGSGHRPYDSGHRGFDRPMQPPPIHQPPSHRPPPGYGRPSYVPPGNIQPGVQDRPYFSSPSRMPEHNPHRTHPINRDMPGGRALK